MNESNLEKQITRVADNMEGIREIMKHIDEMLLQASVERKKKAAKENGGK